MSVAKLGTLMTALVLACTSVLGQSDSPQAAQQFGEEKILAVDHIERPAPD